MDKVLAALKHALDDLETLIAASELEGYGKTCRELHGAIKTVEAHKRLSADAFGTKPDRPERKTYGRSGLVEETGFRPGRLGSPRPVCGENACKTCTPAFRDSCVHRHGRVRRLRSVDDA